MDSFNPTQDRQLRYKFHSCQNKSAHFQDIPHTFVSTCHQIIDTLFSDILPSLFKACVRLLGSIFLLLILLYRDKDGKGKSSNNTLLDCIDVYLISNV